MTETFDVVVIGGGIVGSAVALRLVERGRRVALIERGGETIAEQVDPSPGVRCVGRPHVGVYEARNHVLGGNGHYWGGGIIRPPVLTLPACLGLSRSGFGEDLTSCFQAVEEHLGMTHPPARISDDAICGVGRATIVAEIGVLRGRVRNVASHFYEHAKHTRRLETLLHSTIRHIETKGSMSGRATIASMSVDTAGSHTHAPREISADAYVLANGVIDSNVTAADLLGQIGCARETMGVGHRLHDHLSVPIARVTFDSDTALRTFSPTFRDGLVIGRRIELEGAQGWGSEAFLHFPVHFQEFSPYREIRRIMLLRQQRGRISDYAREVWSLTRSPRRLLRIASERFVHNRLYIDEAVPILATLDFETFPHWDNSIRRSGDGLRFEWEIRSEDIEAFRGHVKNAFATLERLRAARAVMFEPLFDLGSDAEVTNHLQAQATDAYHLGGGLAAGPSGAVDEELRLSGVANAYVVSSAVMARPGLANPTHTLLALAYRLASRL